MANYDGSLKAVDCRIHSVRYDMVLESSLRRLRWPHPHQVTYDVVAVRYDIVFEFAASHPTLDLIRSHMKLQHG
eukprot:scaffold22483_cov128-Skeletonema_dohrnii-CCMP3373.AAC.1